ncbi:MAG: hypothetical protein WC061_02970 [Melioribacteraceae bacterium]
MKKGCFFTSVVLFTLVVGVVVYFVKYNKDYLKEFSKTRVLEMANDELDKKLSEVKFTVYRDSLKNQLKKFIIINGKEQFDTAMARMQVVIAETQYLIKDKIVDSVDYNNFKKQLAGYERSKKN